MASGPITSWQTDVETVKDFIFLGSKITADSDCSHEIKRCLLLGRKVMTNLDSIFKSRDITLPTKVRLVKAMVFPVVMYGCESWTVKKAERWRIDAFELWCWRGPLDGKEIQPRRSVLGVHWKEWCWSWNSNTLATSCEELTRWKRPWCWEGLGAGGKGHDRGWIGWMASSTRWTWVWVNSRRWWWTGRPGVLRFMRSQRNPRADLLQDGLVGSPCSPRDSQESSPTPQFKSINSSVLSLLHSPTLTSIHDHRKKP